MDTLPNISPDFGFTRNSQPRVLYGKFGDGYRQRTADGINTLTDAYTLTWTNITTDEANTLDNFFRAKNGVTAFEWTPPNEGTPTIFTCSQWSKTPTSAGYYRMTANLQQEFDP